MSKETKKQKKARKEEKKTRAIVQEVFVGRNKETKKRQKQSKSRNDKLDNRLVEMITKSVIVNKSVLERDKKQLLEWQNNYYQELFSKFKELIDDHNKIFQFKADDLINKINLKQSELKRLKAEIKQLEAEKELKNA